MLCCQRREKLRKKFFQDIKNFTEKHPTDPFLKILLLRVLNTLLHNESFNIPEYEDKYKYLVHNQTLIGWDQILKGRFTLEWADHINDYIAVLAIKPKKHVSGGTWVRGITTIIFNFASSVWKERNEDRHGRDANDKAKCRLEKAIRSTSSLYRFQSDILPVHSNIFYSNVDEHLEKEETVTQLEAWLNTWTDVIYHSIHRAKTMGITGTRSILNYFSTNR